MFWSVSRILDALLHVSESTMLPRDSGIQCPRCCGAWFKAWTHGLPFASFSSQASLGPVRPARPRPGEPDQHRDADRQAAALAAMRGL